MVWVWILVVMILVNAIWVFGRAVDNHAPPPRNRADRIFSASFTIFLCVMAIRDLVAL